MEGLYTFNVKDIGPLKNHLGYLRRIQSSMYQPFQGDQLDYREDSTLVGFLKWLKNGGESILGKLPIIFLCYLGGEI